MDATAHPSPYPIQDSSDALRSGPATARPINGRPPKCEIHAWKILDSEVGSGRNSAGFERPMGGFSGTKLRIFTLTKVAPIVRSTFHPIESRTFIPFVECAWRP